MRTKLTRRWFYSPKGKDCKWLLRLLNSDLRSPTSTLSPLRTYTSAEWVTAVTEPVVYDPLFRLWPASRTGKHHGHWGGLAQHTYEVLELTLATSKAAHRLRQPSALRDDGILVAAVAAVWHDYGKLKQYQVEAEYPSPDCKIDEVVMHVSESPAGQLQGHIVPGLIELQRYHSKFPSKEIFDRVQHCVIAHHGRKEWGSPVTPQTPEALILHQADMLSVMLNSETNPENR